MTTWRKVFTLFRASAQEPMEKWVDANAIRIFAQELRDTELAMAQAKRELAGLMAESKQLARRISQLENNITLRESQAQQALEKGEDGLALEIADCIAADENLLEEQRQHASQLAVQEKNLRDQLRKAAQTLQHYRRELSLARANRNAEQVLRHLHGHTSGLSTHMGDLAESLGRIKTQQTRFMDVEGAMQELAAEDQGADLDRKLQQVGIGTGVIDGKRVLERLKAQASRQHPAAS